MLWYWAIDLNHLQSFLIPQKQTQKAENINSNNYFYFELLKENQKKPFYLQNYGLHQTLQKSDCFLLTIDLCPSKNTSYEADFFELLEAKNIPAVVALSGSWVKNHKEYFEKIKQNKNIIFINHTFHHPFHFFIDLDGIEKPLPLEKNFLLAEGISIEKEFLENEKLMLENDILPSIFVRFPGLVSDEKILQITHHLGIIPMGKQAWLAKGEKEKAGGILLVHGNKNEPLGIKKAKTLLENEQYCWLSLNDFIERLK